jgi:peptidoglycan/xylan/chitin deacetylase (PgdA/CDA1 family)
MDELLRICTPVSAGSQEPFEPGRRYATVTFDDGFVSVVDNALPELRLRRIPCTIFVPTGSLGRHPSWIRNQHSDNDGETVVPPHVIQALDQEDFVTIGSHSITHPDFRNLDDRRARIELEKSKADLEAILGKSVNFFSFPYGGCTQRCFQLAQQAGYKRVFTIDSAMASASPDRFVWGRVRVDPSDSLLEFRLKVSGAYRWLSRASAWKRRLQGFATKSAAW